MYNGTNPRALESQKWLADAALSLMQEKSFKDITIGEICKQADVSRQTFYNCFDDKKDVLHYMILRRYDRMERQISNIKIRDPHTILEILMTFFEENKAFFLLLMEHGQTETITQAVSEVMERFIGIVTLEEADAKTEKYGTAFLSGAISSLLICWLQDPDPLDDVGMEEFLEQILGGSYYHL